MPEETTQQASNAKKKVLIVEDDKFLSKALKDKLTRENFDVVTAFNGQSALDELARGTFDIILLDLIMPVMDGFDALKQIKANKATKNIPVIVLSNLGQDTDMVRVTQMGVVDYFVKADTPITDIVGQIEKHLG